MTYSTRTMRAEDWAEFAPYFTPDEFRSPKRMGYEYMHFLLRVRKRAGVKMVVTSSVRNRIQNTAAGGATDSAHMDVVCEATDFMPENSHARFKIIEAAMAEGCTRIGIYANGSVHLDRTEGRRPPEVLWTVAKPKKKS